VLRRRQATDAALSAGDEAAARRLVREATAARDQSVLDVLARHSRRGDRMATELLVEAIDALGVARAFVREVLLDETAVDDVTQDVLVSVVGAIGTFTGDAKFTTWLHTIARRRVVNHLRRLRSDASLTQSDLGPAQRISSLIATRETVRHALAQLPDLYRQPVWLRDIDGLPYGEVANRLGRSVGTVKSQVSRGRALVAGLIGGEAATGDDHVAGDPGRGA
jgi:RNA polymerase sigma-70 factor (ECF subfamily)